MKALRIAVGLYRIGQDAALALALYLDERKRLRDLRDRVRDAQRAPVTMVEDIEDAGDSWRGNAA